MRRLYLQIYLSVLAVLVLWSLLASLAWLVAPPPRSENRLYDQIAEVLGEVLPGPQTPRAEVEAALERLGTRFRSDLTLYDASGAVLGSFGEPVSAPSAAFNRNSHWGYSRRGPLVSLRLPDGRSLVARHVHEHDPWHAGWLLLPALLAAAVGIAAYPVVRRLTGRLERLQMRVDALAAGELTARVQVEGKDEVADLAKSFNRAAERIERLVNAQKTLLASASHELRSPLARMRVAVELLAGDDRPELRERVARDVAELDELIEELLLASRLDTLERLDRVEDVDLLALAAEEGSRLGAQISGEAVVVRGDGRMLRRMVRNLLENARRYGGEQPIEVSVARGADGTVVLRVDDRGPGVPEADRERVFEAFYRLPGTRETTEGVGLGLALVRQIAQRHQGDAHCLAREGGGSRFEVRLPG